MDDFVDRKTGVLKNLLRIKDQNVLDDKEREITDAKIVEFEFNIRPSRTFDRNHLKAIHKQIFGDIYEWAGSMRDESPIIEGQKIPPVPVLRKGNSVFLPASRFDDAFEQAFLPIIPSELEGITDEQFADIAGDLLADLNHIHPFREGNGRAQRILIEELGRETGHSVDFRGITRARMIEASIATSQDPQSDAMRHLMLDAVDAERVQALMTAAQKLTHSGFEPNDRYVRTSREGEQVEGKEIFRDGQFRHVVTASELVLVKEESQRLSYDEALKRAEGELKNRPDESLNQDDDQGGQKV